jgi:osmotically-inducible protein OsmY
MRLAMAVLVGSLAVSVGSATADPSPGRQDADVERDVHAAILGSLHYGVFDSVGVVVRDGDVVLEGSVLRGFVRGEIEKRVSRVAGVRSVTNRLTVQSFSTFDDQLRRQIFRSIYGGDTLLPHTAFAAPVHIVVNRGRVTLTGYVNSRVEQVKVGMKARETAAFSVDNRVKLEGDRHAEAGRI